MTIPEATAETLARGPGNPPFCSLTMIPTYLRALCLEAHPGNGWELGTADLKRKHTNVTKPRDSFEQLWGRSQALDIPLGNSLAETEISREWAPDSSLPSMELRSL